MEKLIEKVENLKQSLEEEQIVIELKKVIEQVKSNKELTSLINKYHTNPTEELKSEIIKEPLFRQYKEKETDLNLLILQINSELKKITKKDKCSL